MGNTQLRTALITLALASSAFAALPSKQSNAGDSISQGFSANGWLGDHPNYSWVQGTDSGVDSMFLRYRALNPSFSQQAESVTGAELVGGGDNFAAQSKRICGQSVKPQHVTVLLGGNDVCNRSRSSTSNAAANMYSVTTWRNALRAGLDQLAACLPAGSTVQVLSAPRVDYLYNAGHAKTWYCPYVVWPTAGICRIVTAENSATRREQIGQRINAYNDATAQEIAAYQSNANGKNPRGLHFVTDWKGSIEQGHRNTSIGTYAFSAGDINGTDCFHPNTTGQHKLACSAWASDPDGSGAVSTCLQ